MTTATVTARDLLPWEDLVRSDYSDMPGMRLTPAQAQRLWSIDPETCRQVLDALVDSRYLAFVDGCYCRADCLDGVWSLD